MGGSPPPFSSAVSFVAQPSEKETTKYYKKKKPAALNPHFVILHGGSAVSLGLGGRILCGLESPSSACDTAAQPQKTGILL